MYLTKILGPTINHIIFIPKISLLYTYIYCFTRGVQLLTLDLTLLYCVAARLTRVTSAELLTSAIEYILDISLRFSCKGITDRGINF